MFVQYSELNFYPRFTYQKEFQEKKKLLGLCAFLILWERFECFVMELFVVEGKLNFQRSHENCEEKYRSRFSSKLFLSLQNLFHLQSAVFGNTSNTLWLSNNHCLDIYLLLLQLTKVDVKIFKQKIDSKT